MHTKGKRARQSKRDGGVGEGVATGGVRLFHIWWAWDVD